MSLRRYAFSFAIHKNYLFVIGMKGNSKNISSGVLIGTMIGVGISFSSGTRMTEAQELTVPQLQERVRSLLDSVEALQVQIAKKQNEAGSPNVSGEIFWRDLAIGSRGVDVKALQRFLNSRPETRIAEKGIGAPGEETEYFGILTQMAVKKFQVLYKNEILAPLGLSEGTGFVGVSTRAKLNDLYR